MQLGNLGKEYLVAVENPEFRPEFIKRLDIGDMARYVDKVVYTSRLAHNPNAAMRTIPKPESGLLYPGVQSTILIHPHAFTHTYGEFMAQLIFHEGTHAYEIFHDPILFFGFPRPNVTQWMDREYLSDLHELSDYFHAKAEERAYENEYTGSYFADDIGEAYKFNALVKGLGYHNMAERARAKVMAGRAKEFLEN